MHTQRTTPRRRPRAVLTVALTLTATLAGLLASSPAGAVPGTAAEATAKLAETAQQLTLIDGQIDEAAVTVEAQQAQAAAAAERAVAAQAALTAYEPQLRAIARSGYTGKSQSGMAAFLTSESADELVQQMTTLDVIADRANTVVAEVGAAQDAAEQAQAAAEETAAAARTGLEQLEAQKAEVKERIDGYEADFARLSATEQATVTAAVAGPTLQTPSVGSLPPAPGEAATVAVKTALAQVGDEYVWGASGPDGFDCSGLTSYAYAAAGLTLPRASRSQAQVGADVPRAELQPGDLVFFYDPISHVGLYIGNGMMVHARTFGQPVAVTTVDQRGYRFAKRITG